MPSFHDPPRGGKAVIRSPLRLVHPAPPSPASPHRARHEGRVFTDDEQDVLRATLRNLRARWGTWKALAATLECSPDVLRQACKRRIHVSAAVVLRLCFVLRCAPQDLVQGLRAVSPPGGAP